MIAPLQRAISTGFPGSPAIPVPPTRRVGALWRCLRVLLLVILVPGLGLGGFALYLVASHNFHVITPGVLYRSSQMGGDALARTIRDHGIKTILNLRGEADGQSWYMDEIAVSRRYGVQHLDFPLSATRELTTREMDEILDALAKAPKPILIHCKSGSDRTGLVGALYEYSIEGRPAQSAQHQLAVLYGHLPFLLWSGTIAMDRSYWHYVETHGPAAVSAKAPPLAQQPEQAAAAVLARGSAQ